MGAVVGGPGGRVALVPDDSCAEYPAGLLECQGDPPGLSDQVLGREAVGSRVVMGRQVSGVPVVVVRGQVVPVRVAALAAAGVGVPQVEP